MTSNDERRDYYRIEDTVGLSYESCRESELPTTDEFLQMVPDEFQLINQLKSLDIENSSLLHSLQEQSPDVARYFKLLNAKIEAIAKSVITQGLTEEIASSGVELSAGGLSFITDTMLATDSYLKLRMILYPSSCVINCYGQVVRSDSVSNGFDTAIKYILITEADRDTLVRHVLQLQSNELRKKSLQKN